MWGVSYHHRSPIERPLETGRHGINAAVLAIVVQALLRIGGRALNTPFKR